ncbi:D-alanyl-D-alanine carboxypeptidase/D-alanyl-D-alanine-endopeptidase [Nocardioides sp.]|uniref:D-alanyl-D-alanine carboxypeptidase/D-alanyl-D-alanine endopeptidase n=1 Tax=Nocardioides sp. TaxID=35761 RepID=UPI00262D108A|nr:D-alanyl-D-alanine carboxypeptidase/D-alanyl-D-alanine-endopeptidase [Nocardioides sp.]
MTKSSSRSPSRSSSRSVSRSAPQASGGSLRGTLVLVLVLLLVGGGVATWRYDLLDGPLDSLLGGDQADAPSSADVASSDPVSVAPPPGLQLPEVVRPDPVAQPSPTGGALDPAAVRRALAPYLRRADLGRHVRAEVALLGGGPAVFTAGEQPAIPASTTKLVTSTAALLALGSDHVFTTTTVLARSRRGAPRLTLVGGGDPFLERDALTPSGEDWPYPARADLTTLADKTAAALREAQVRRVRVSYDDALFTGPAENPTWEDDYLIDVVSPTSALWVDEGRTITRFGRVADPSADAASAFTTALRGAGVKVVAGPEADVAPDRGEALAQVESAPLGEIVQRIIDVSDNEAAEVLLRHVGLAEVGAGSTEAGRRGVRRVLGAEGIRLGPSRFLDGSGLSRASRAEPGLLVDVLRLAADPSRPDLRAVVEGLPVAGFTGSLAIRMDEGPPAGLGRIRAKTGTLESVSSLAGIGTDLDGTVFVFVLMADRIPESGSATARTTLDSAAASLGACRCSP